MEIPDHNRKLIRWCKKALVHRYRDSTKRSFHYREGALGMACSDEGPRTAAPPFKSLSTWGSKNPWIILCASANGGYRRDWLTSGGVRTHTNGGQWAGKGGGKSLRRGNLRRLLVCRHQFPFLLEILGSGREGGIVNGRRWDPSAVDGEDE
jgi:hypothetical protein